MTSKIASIASKLHRLYSSTRSKKALSAGITLIILPILAACTQETARNPVITPTLQPSPSVLPSPNGITPAPTTPISPNVVPTATPISPNIIPSPNGVTQAPTAPISPGISSLPNTATSTAPAANDIVSVVANNPSLSTLETLITATGLGQNLQSGGSYTIFAPSDQAFAALPPSTQQQLLRPENQNELRQLLTYHVVANALPANALSSGQIQSLEGTPLAIAVDPSSNQVRINNATVTQANIPASNGVIHVVDQVILPSTAPVQ